MKENAFFSLIFILAFATCAFCQDTGVPATSQAEQEAAKEADEKRKEIAMALIKEAGLEIESLQSLGNRISFSANLADVAYDIDPDLSRRMYLGLTDAISRQMSSALATFAEIAALDESGSPARSSRGRGIYLKMMRSQGIRSQAVLSAAAHDPLLGLDVLEGTRVTYNPGNAELKAMMGAWGGNDDGLLAQIVEKIRFDNAETLDEFSRRILKNGLSTAAVRLLTKIRQKDPEKGAAYAGQVFSAAGKEVDVIDPDLNAIYSLISYASEEVAKPSPRARAFPLVTRAEIGNLAERFGRLVLRLDKEDVEYYSASIYAGVVKPYSPALARQIEKRFGVESDEETTMSTAMPPPPPPAASMEGEAVRAKEKVDEEARLAAKSARREDLMQRMSSPEDDPEKEAAARHFADEGIREALEIEDPVARIQALVDLAGILKAKGQMKLANEVLDEAHRSVTNNPKNYSEFLQIWTLAGGLVDSDKEVAFAMVEDLVFRLNDVAAGFIRFGEFIDSGGEIVEDGELQFGGPGGGMVGSMIGTLDASGDVIRKFGEADFARTKALADRFDRPEIRVVARLLILNSLYGKPEKPEAATDDIPDSIDEGT